jgi:hypothetical protein
MIHMATFKRESILIIISSVKTCLALSATVACGVKATVVGLAMNIVKTNPNLT